jgi:limonene 1,2-monooxygenase
MSRLRFGYFTAPFHPAGENPTLALDRDIELVQWLDQLGFDEAWFGEHHSGGFEVIACPELMVAAAAKVTRHIKLGTGVTSVPYHHPLHVADRWIQLDHMTRGRAMFGVGPGALASDAYMLGIPVSETRRMMEEGLVAIDHLLHNDEPISMETDWFKLQDATLNFRPYSEELDIAFASIASPAGPRLAGRFGAGLLSLSVTSDAVFEVLGSHWDVWGEKAEEYGTIPDRRKWRLVAPMHIAETREKAFENVKYGIERWVEYFRTVVALQFTPDTDDAEAFARELVDTGFAVIGTPDDACELIHRLQEQTGGFGAFLVMANDWANRENTMKSYELMAKYVFPEFQNSATRAIRSNAWAMDNYDRFLTAAGDGVVAAIEAHAREQEAKGRHTKQNKAVESVRWASKNKEKNTPA